QQNLELDVARAELQLKELKEKLEQVKYVDLPELMEEVGCAEFKLPNGFKVSIKTDLRGYIREEDKGNVYEWLRKNNHGSIIKAHVTANFGMGEVSQSDQIYQYLLSKGINASKKEDIHPMTFNKFIRECMEEGLSLHDKIQVQPIKEARIRGRQ